MMRSTLASSMPSSRATWRAASETGAMGAAGDDDWAADNICPLHNDSRASIVRSSVAKQLLHEEATMSAFAEQVRATPSVREPAYRPAMWLSEPEKAELERKIGDASVYQDLVTLREMVRQQPDNVELKKALVSAIASAEFAGIDAFSRKVVEWQDWPVPQTLIMAIARQTWDEVRHAWLAKGLVESYGGEIGEYPDTLAGGAPP